MEAVEKDNSSLVEFLMTKRQEVYRYNHSYTERDIIKPGTLHINSAKKTRMHDVYSGSLKKAIDVAKNNNHKLYHYMNYYHRINGEIKPRKTIKYQSLRRFFR